MNKARQRPRERDDQAQAEAKTETKTKTSLTGHGSRRQHVLCPHLPIGPKNLEKDKTRPSKGKT